MIAAFGKIIGIITVARFVQLYKKCTFMIVRGLQREFELDNREGACQSYLQLHVYVYCMRN